MKATPPAKGKATTTVKDLMSGTKRLSIDVPDALHLAIKHYCIDHGVTINDLGVRLFRQLLEGKR